MDRLVEFYDFNVDPGHDPNLEATDPRRSHSTKICNVKPGAIGRPAEYVQVDLEAAIRLVVTQFFRRGQIKAGISTADSKRLHTSGNETPVDSGWPAS